MDAPNKDEPSTHTAFVQRLDRSALLVLVGVVLLFSTAVIVTLVAPRYVDSTWTTPSSSYQVQMYEVEDPHFYISSAATEGHELQYVHHLKEGFTLSAFRERDTLRLIATTDLEPFITRHEDPQLKLTSRLLFLREPVGEMRTVAEELRQELREKWSEKHPGEAYKHDYEILELYDPQLTEAFSWEPSGGILGDWVDENFIIVDKESKHPYHSDGGVVYVHNPREFRIIVERTVNRERWRYDPNGRVVKDLKELKGPLLGFYSRRELIEWGEHLYAIEGCYYCHTDQTRTLIEDVVINGTDAYPAPPSSAHEYIYQKITFPGTRRIGPDISRVGVKRPSREWHQTHFWSPTTASVGSIMPAFPQFFEPHPRGTGKSDIGVPNERFEAMYQYLMTKGTRITPPTQAWWLGKDPVKTKEIIEGSR